MKSSEPSTSSLRALPLIALVALAIPFAGCGGGSGSPPATSNSTTSSAPGGGSAPGNNVMQITVNGTLCSAATSQGYMNKPCVSVTVCTPDNSSCQTVSDLLLDTGSYGLRIFSQALPGMTLPFEASGSGTLAECVQFADGSSIWGPVATALVQLGGETAVQMPIQLIDASFATPTSCGTPEPDPAAAGFSGVLGVGPLPQDCGADCVNSARVGMYFSCSGSSCTGTTVPLLNQVPNPVSSLTTDNNGILLQLPAVSATGASSVSGSLILGIGTQANNTPSPAPTVLALDQQSNFLTVFNGSTLTSFLDTGTNALFFPDQAIQVCSGDWFCPPSALSLSAVLSGSTGTPSVTEQFTIANFTSLQSTGNNVFSNVGNNTGPQFDWGLPFFLGKGVYVGIDGKGSTLGTGPFVAY